MKSKRFKPLVDKFFFIISIPTAVLMIVFTLIAAFHPSLLFVAVPMDILVLFCIISPLFGYAELRENTVFVKYGLLFSREIPYDKIRGIEKERKIYSESMISLKNSLEHVNIKYNAFDVTTVSVINNDDFIRELNERRQGKQSTP